MILGRILLKNLSIGFWARCKQQWKNSLCYLAKSMWKHYFSVMQIPFRHALNNFTNFFSKWKSSLKINQMYLYVFLLSNYLDSFFPKRMFGNDHHHHSQKISYRDFRTNRQQATKKWNWSAQKMLLHAVCRSQVFPQCEKTRNLHSFERNFVK